MTQRAPLRLSEAASDATPELRAAVRRARTDGPNPAQLERLIGGVIAQLPTPRAHDAGTRAPRPATSAGLHGLRWLLLVALGAGAVLWAIHALRPPTPQRVTAHGAAAAMPNQVATEVSTAQTPLPQAQLPEPARPAAPAVAIPAAHAKDLQPRARRAASRAQPADPGAEIALLQQARRALPSAPEQALALSRSHERLFPEGTFREEREAVAIEALLALGRSDDAQARARALLQRYPQSAYRRRIERLLAAPERSL